MTKAFSKIMTGLDEVEDFLEGARDGYGVHVPDHIDIKAIRRKLKLSQPKFAETFGFSVGRLRDWEQGRHEVDAPSRAFLRVIEREPEAVLRALAHPAPSRRGKSPGKAA